MICQDRNKQKEYSIKVYAQWKTWYQVHPWLVTVHQDTVHVHLVNQSFALWLSTCSRIYVNFTGIRHAPCKAYVFSCHRGHPFWVWSAPSMMIDKKCPGLQIPCCLRDQYEVRSSLTHIRCSLYRFFLASSSTWMLTVHGGSFARVFTHTSHLLENRRPLWQTKKNKWQNDRHACTCGSPKTHPLSDCDISHCLVRTPNFAKVTSADGL